MMVLKELLVTVIMHIVLYAATAKGSGSYDPEASITGLYTGPYFDPLAPRNLTAHMGDRAQLPCTVRQLGDKSVSWVRMRDADILTVDRYTFVGDERFEAHYSTAGETWTLIINYVQERDAGEYECQVSTEPKMSQFFNLRVVVPQVNVEPPGDRHVKAGSKVRIECHITDVVEIPDYIFWYHDKIRVLDRTDPNLEVVVTRTGEESIMSSLIIERVRKEQSGNYTCMPSNLHSASTLLHVLNEEHPAAMQDGRNNAPGLRTNVELLFLTLCCLLMVTTGPGALMSDAAGDEQVNSEEVSVDECQDKNKTSEEQPEVVESVLDPIVTPSAPIEVSHTTQHDSLNDTTSDDIIKGHIHHHHLITAPAAAVPVGRSSWSPNVDSIRLCDVIKKEVFSEFLKR